MSLGPGFQSYLVPEAKRAIASAEVVIGYRTYLELLTALTAGKRVVASGMRKEMERCREAIEEALAGRCVALVSSGDAGIYGMAGLVFDLCRARGLAVGVPGESRRHVHGEPGEKAITPGRAERNDAPVDLYVGVIPGVPAFNAAASILGAPLMHDFAAVSLSDHLTPWELIEKRLVAAASADFVLAIYNPRSKARPHLLQRAQALLLRQLPRTTPVGIVRRAMRAGQWRHVTTLAAIPFDDVDMQTVLIVGNSRTYCWGDWMVTPRGYLDKYGPPTGCE